MATYTTIPDSELLADAPVTTSLMFRMRDNPEAVVEGNATKKIASGAFNDNSVSGAKIAINTLSGDRLLNNSVSAAKLQDGTVSSSKLNLVTGQLDSGVIANNGTWNVNLPQYTLNYRIETGDSTWTVTGFTVGSGAATSPGFVLKNNSGGSSSARVLYQAFA